MAEFMQQVDHIRPHTLITRNPKFSGSLEYRYNDTGEHVSVPNLWYNQTGASRVAAIRYDAQIAIEHAERFETNPPYGTTPAAAKDIARRYRARAGRINAEADRMQAAIRSTHPVAAAQMQLEYGPNV